MKNAITWFDIPVIDFERAVKFYEEIFGISMYKEPMGGHEMAFFPCDRGGVGGALVQYPGGKPTTDGTMVYFDGGENLSTILSKVETAGGKIIVPKKLIREDIGYFAIFIDIEGNRVALHSAK